MHDGGSGGEVHTGGGSGIVWFIMMMGQCDAQ